ncbi:MAG: response regulator [Parvibaculaceae bacterium]|nr:response regulator [Parvibaculaceae bacterium]
MATAQPQPVLPALLILGGDESRSRSLSGALISRGFDCVYVTSLNNPVDQVRNNARIRVALVDLSALGAQGYRVIRELRFGFVNRHMDVIVISEQNSPEAIIEMLRLGVVDFLVKPTGDGDIVSAVERAIARQTLELEGERMSTGEAGKVAPSPQARPVRPQDALNRIDEVTALRLLVGLERLKSRHRERSGVDEIELNMLIDLAWHMSNNRPVSVTALAFGSGAPLATAHRRLRKLETQGLVSRQRDHSDGRQINLTLTSRGLTSVQGLETDVQTLSKRLVTEAANAALAAAAAAAQ